MKKYNFNFGILYTVILVISLVMALTVSVLRIMAILGAMDMISSNISMDIALALLTLLIATFVILTLTTSSYLCDSSSLVMRLALVNVRYDYKSMCRVVLNLKDHKLWLYYTSDLCEPSCINVRIHRQNIPDFVTTLRKHNPSIVYLEIDPSVE